MFYENYINTKKINYKTLRYPSFEGLNASVDDNVMSIKNSPLTYNFDCTSGVLYDGIGVHKLRFKCYPDDVTYKELDDLPTVHHPTACWLFTAWAKDIKIHRSFLIVLDSIGDVYYNRLHNQSTYFTKIEGLNFTSEPIVVSCNIDGEDTLVFVSENEGMYTWTFPSIVSKIENAPSLSSICVHNNRLFATTYDEKRSIVYSDDINPTNFNLDLKQGGEIGMVDEFGCCNKVLSFKGYLYIFRDFNIAKLVDYVNKTDFELSQLYVSNGRIFDKTVCVCGDSIIYLASDGVYQFDGNSAKRLSFSLDKMFEGIDNYHAVAGYSDGYYYLACKLNYDDNNAVVDGEWQEGNNNNNALIKLNVATGEIVLMRGYDVVGIYVINDIYRSEVCVLVREVGAIFRLGMLDMSGKYYNKSFTKVWNSPVSDFGYPHKYKLIKEISFETRQDIDIEIVTEKGKKIIKVKGKNMPQTINVNIKCKKFGVNFVSKTTDNYITNPQIVVGIL